MRRADVVAQAMTSTFLNLRITAAAGIWNAQAGTGITSCAATLIIPLSSPLSFIPEYHTVARVCWSRPKKVAEQAGERRVGCIRPEKITSCVLATVTIGPRLRSNVPGAPSTPRMRIVQSSVEGDRCADSRRQAPCCAKQQPAWGKANESRIGDTAKGRRVENGCFVFLALRHFKKTSHPLPQPRASAAIRRRIWSREHRASCGERMRCPSGPRACRSASSATLRCSRLVCARLNEGRRQAPFGWRACDFSVFFFSVEAPPTVVNWGRIACGLRLPHL